MSRSRARRRPCERSWPTAKTPKSIQERLYAEIKKALDSPEIKERLSKLGADPMPMTSAEFTKLVRDEVAMNKDLVKAAGIKAN